MDECKRVVITGMGMLTSLGLNLKSNWENLLAGRGGIKKITLFDPSTLETQIGGQIPDDFESIANSTIPRRERKQMTRTTKMAILSAREAIEGSKINFCDYDTHRVAVIMGVLHTSYNDMERTQSESNIIVKSMPNAPSAWITLLYGLEGPNFNISTACASSAYAIGLGCEMIRCNIADVVIVGGTDSHIDPEKIKGFNQILALSMRNDSPQTASRPFTQSRDGFVIGEGAGVMILESEKSAKERNALIYGEVAGYYIMSEATNIVAPKNGGVGMAKTMELALKNAKTSKDDVSYINAHGTSTYLNDKYETMAIKRVFGDRAYEIAVSSSKSMIGHTIGSAGILEGIITVMSIHQSVVTPTINYIDPDPELDLDYVPNKSKKQNITAALSNSFGFGGHNASIIFHKYNT